MLPNKVDFSILTPTRNRSKYIYRVWHSLFLQSNKSFEWIVSDDGSTDGTESIIRQLAKKSDFKIIYIRANRHVGKIRMDNEAIRCASGLLTLWCDSDDYLLPNALGRLWETWNTIPIHEKPRYVGMTALAATKEGCIVNPFPGVDVKDVSWNDLAELYQVTSDMVFCVRSDILKAHPFPEVDLVIPESVVWTAIGHRPARLLPEVIKMVEYQADHAISFTKTMNYNRGRAYAMVETVKKLQHYWRPWHIRIWRLALFIRYSIHGEIPIKKARHLWGENSTGLLYWLVFPLAYLIAVKDRLQGKVRYSQREFLANRDTVTFSMEILNQGIRL